MKTRAISFFLKSNLIIFSLFIFTAAVATSPNVNIDVDTGIENCPCDKTTGGNGNNSIAGASNPGLSNNGGMSMSISFGNTGVRELNNGPLSFSSSITDPEILFSPSVLKYPTIVDRRVMYVNRDYDPSNPNHDWGGYPTTINTISFGSQSYEYQKTMQRGVWRVGGEYGQETPIIYTYSDSTMQSLTSTGFTYIVEELTDGTKVHYPYRAVTGTELRPAEHIISSTGEMLKIGPMKNEIIYRGTALRQIYGEIDGLLDIVGNAYSTPRGFRIDWYPPEQVTGKNDGYYVFSGSPAKSWVVTNPSVSPLQIKIEEVRHGIPELRFPNVWTYYNNDHWELRKGEGTEAVVESEETLVSGTGRVVTKTVKDYNGNIVSRISKEYEKINGHDKLIRTVEDPNGANYITTNEYNSAGLLVKTISPNGMVKEYTYDSQGRPATAKSQTVYGERAYEYTYSDNGEFNIATEKINGSVLYNIVHRTTVTNTGGQRISVIKTVGGVSREQRTETYGYNESNSFSAGRTKLIVHENGNEEFYEYIQIENGYKEIATTQADGLVIPSLSTKRIRFYVQGNITREEIYAHTGNAFSLVSWKNFTYNAAHQVIRTDYSDGRYSTATWICKGPLETIDETGIRTEYQYDSAKRNYKTIRYSPMGTVTTTKVLDPLDRVLSITSTSENISQTSVNQYDRLGRLIKTTSAAGLSTTFSYTSGGNITTSINPSGATEIVTRHSDGSVISVTGTAGVPKYYSYSFSNGLKVMTEYVGMANSARFFKNYTNGFNEIVRSEKSAYNNTTVTTVYTHDSKGNLIQSKIIGGQTINYGYDALGNQTESYMFGIQSNDLWYAPIHKRNSRIIEFEDNGDAIWLKTTNTLSAWTDSSYGGGYAPASKTTISKQQLSGLSNSLISKEIQTDIHGNDRTIWSSYDRQTYRRTFYQTYPGMNGTTSVVTLDGKAISFTPFSGAPKSRTYDALGRLTSETNGRGNTVQYTYGQNNKLSRVINAANAVTEFFYDNAGRLTAIKDPLGKFKRYAYDASGKKIAEYGEAIYPTFFSYNVYGETTSHSTYRNPNGMLTGLPSEQNADRTQYQYDAASGLLTLKTEPNGASTQYEYNSFGQMVKQTSPRGIITNYDYDDYGYISHIDYSDSTPSLEIYRLYFGEIEAVRSLDYQIRFHHFEYNQYGEKINESIYDDNGFDAFTVFSRDNYGRTASKSVKINPWNSMQPLDIIYYDFDDYGRVENIQVGNDESDTFNLIYHAEANLLTSLSYPCGIVKSIEYATNRNLVSSISNMLDGQVLSKYEYQHDLLNRNSLKTQTFEGVSDNYEFNYNDRSELIAMTDGNNLSASYSYDNIGNRVYSTDASGTYNYASNQLNQYTGITPHGESQSIPIAYDLDGNQTKIRTSTGDWDVEYDAENRPIRFSQSGNSIALEFSYDFMGRKTDKKLYYDGMEIEHTGFLYNGYLLTAEVNCFDNTLIRSYVWDPTAGKASKPLMYRDHRSNSDYYYLHDANKNVTELIDEWGNVVEHYEYTPYGLPNSAYGWLDNPFRFSSEYYDEDIGLICYTYRCLNPLTGRWISRDPLGEQGGYNLYGMVQNNPMNLFDIQGLIGWNPFKWSDGEPDWWDPFSWGHEWEDNDWGSDIWDDISDLWDDSWAEFIVDITWTKTAEAITVVCDKCAMDAQEYQDIYNFVFSPNLLGDNPMDCDEVKIEKTIIRKTWTLPNTVIGFAASIAGSSFTLRYDVDIFDNVISITGMGFPRAVSLGNIILINPDDFRNDDELWEVSVEENAHSYQSELLGPLYIPLHVLSQLCSVSKSKTKGERHDTHKYNPLEQYPPVGFPFAPPPIFFPPTYWPNPPAPPPKPIWPNIPPPIPDPY